MGFLVSFIMRQETPYEARRLPVPSLKLAVYDALENYAAKNIVARSM